MLTSSKKNFYVLAGSIIAFLILILIIPLSAGIPNSNFLMIVDYGDGHLRKFTGSSKAGVSAWDSLQQAAAHSYLQVDTTKDFYPKIIDSKENGKDGKQWALYINKKKISESPINIKINGGDTIVWKFE